MERLSVRSPLGARASCHAQKPPAALRKDKSAADRRHPFLNPRCEMGVRIVLLLGCVVALVASATCRHDGDEADEHRVVKRGILDSIASGARSLRDGAAEFFGRSWSSVKAAFTDLMNWLRGVPSPRNDQSSKPPPAPSAGGETEFGVHMVHHHHDHQEPCPESRHEPTIEPTQQRGSTDATVSRASGPASTTTAQSADDSTVRTVGGEDQSAASPAATSSVATTLAPALETAEVAKSATMSPSDDSDGEAPETTQERTASTPQTTTRGAVGSSATRDVAAPTATAKTPVPSIDATSRPTLPPDDSDPSENDIDSAPSNKPPQRRRNGPGFVISDAH